MQLSKGIYQTMCLGLLGEAWVAVGNRNRDELEEKKISNNNTKQEKVLSRSPMTTCHLLREWLMQHWAKAPKILDITNIAFHKYLKFLFWETFIHKVFNYTLTKGQNTGTIRKNNFSLANCNANIWIFINKIIKNIKSFQ